jgi:arabinogalactan oligomer / maltooligosaccharide transport system substrate-binding protein
VTRAVKVAAGAVLIALAAGCTAGGAPSTHASASVGGHLVWWDIGTQTGVTAADQELAQSFENAHPGTTVDVQVLAPDDARGRFDSAAQAAAGAPDVITLESSWVPDFGSRGYLAPLDTTVDASVAGSVFPSLVSTERFDGRTVAVVRSADGPALLYNPDLLRQAGVKVPTTWQDVSEDRLRLTAKGVQTLYAPATAEGLLPWIYGDGGLLADAAAKTIEISQPAAVAGLSDRLELQATGVAVDDSSPGSTDAMRTSFRQGRVAMIIDQAASLPLLTGGLAFPTQTAIGIAPMPVGRVRSSSPLTATAYAVYAGSPNLLTAEEFVKEISSPANQAALAERLGLLPASPAAYEQDAVRADPVVTAFRPVVRDGTAMPQVPQQDSLLPPLDDAFHRALTEDGSPQSLLDDVATAYLKVLQGFTIGPPPA